MLSITIRWDVIFIELFVILLLILLIGFIFIFKFKKCVKAHNMKKWNYILRQKFVLKSLSKSTKLYNDCMYLLARANFELYNDKEFEVYVDKINSSTLLAKKNFLKISYIIIRGNNISVINDLMNELKLLNDEESKKYYLVCDLLYKIKFEKYACSTDENNTIKSLLSDRISIEILGK